MSQVIFKRGTEEDLQKEPLQDGLFSITTDDGKIHVDFLDENNELKRKTLYSGRLQIGPYIYDGSEDISIKIYEGENT